ncbi:hypothetical protein UFOVP1383_10 [uncultured Caudovirales phage]|uniref:Uncharacterized protein n=1 Tax=uncultured Caudovirales phage TaxID=2100421 RepID=A0A6J5S5R6_9CAUD|nr:hypothetical protein UFOVP848_31 [uncultured Caudovirales phage]CAB4173294.1 hypothetical protein UFOVP945_34 [uncultured Caudovirales phage]CAB4179599.1 hypothetical protein UFOVP1023_8 [uncultured Caudovirales phage]CAB4203850.1 hypothetical protein UFOVP1383_10 [uncultured Caudovirales phage]CAB4215995.1 hypothetical protein UFOVP1477_38 [uncultured Caudovirales phage]
MTSRHASARSWSFLVPLPVQGLGQNARVHWAAKNRAVDAYRREVVLEVLGLTDRPWEPLDRVRVTLVARYQGTRGPSFAKTSTPEEIRALERYRPTDADNLIAACKPLIDALCVGADYELSACLVAGDKAKNVELATPRFETVSTWAEEGVFVTVEELE